MVAVSLGHPRSCAHPGPVVCPKLASGSCYLTSSSICHSWVHSADSHPGPALTKPCAGRGHTASLTEPALTLVTQLLEGSPKHEAYLLPGDKVHPPRER